MPKPKDLRDDETKVFICGICKQPLEYRLPRFLKGVFMHMKCRFFSDPVLNAEVIS